MKAGRLIVAAGALTLCPSAAHSSVKIPQPSWPNPGVIDNYLNEEGDTCPITGGATAPEEKKKSNALKNRYKLPANVFEQTLLSKPFEISSGGVDSPPGVDHADQQLDNRVAERVL